MKILKLRENQRGGNGGTAKKKKGWDGMTQEELKSMKSAIRNQQSEIGRILIADDEEIVHLTLKRLLEPEGYTVDSAYGGVEALRKLTHSGMRNAECGMRNKERQKTPHSKIPTPQSEIPIPQSEIPTPQSEIPIPQSEIPIPQSGYDLLILDIRMPDMDGIEVLREIRKREIEIEVFILTGYASLESATHASNYGVRGYLMKPIENIPEFKSKISSAIKIAKLTYHNRKFYEAIVSSQVDSITTDGKLYPVPTIREEFKVVFQHLMEVTRDAVVFLDFDGNVTFSNVNFAQMIGESYQNLLGARFDSYAAEGSKDRIIEVITQLSSGQVAVSIPSQLKTSYGSFLSVIISASPIYYKMEYCGIALVITDVTEMQLVREKVELLANLVENAQYDMMFIMNPEGQIIECNSLATRAFGYPRSEILGLNIASLLKFEADKDWGKIRDCVERESSWRGDIMAIARDGKASPVEMTISKAVSGVNAAANIICFMRDLTERVRAAEELEKLRVDYHNIITNSIDAIVVTGRDGIIRFVNPRAEATFGRTSEELNGELFGFPIMVSELTEIDLIRRDGEIGTGEMRVTETEWVEKPAYLISIRDVTERKRAEDQIKASLKEKEVLLKEIHHRVKNNLQVVSSLLNLQSERIEDKNAAELFKISQNRIDSMALIHEELYQSEDLARVDFAEYIQKLVTELYSSYGVDCETIKLNINAENILLDINKAIPCGLIINELVSNSLKHAFPDGKEGELSVVLRSDNNTLTLTIRDTGVGFPKDMDFRNTESLGMQLVVTLTNQLDGTIELDRSGGTTFNIIFAKL